jgi:hypothetical protein
MENNKLVMNPVNDLVKNQLDAKIAISEYILSDEVGTLDKLTFVAKLKATEKLIKSILESPDIKEIIQDVTDAELSGAPIDTDFGYRLQQAVTKTGYVYDECNHIVLDFLKVVNDYFKDEVKEIQTELKAVKQGQSKKIIIDADKFIKLFKLIFDSTQEVIDTLNETGGVVTVNAPKKIQTISLKMTKLKNLNYG